MSGDFFSSSFFHPIISIIAFSEMASENGRNSIDYRDLDNDADFLQNKGYDNDADFLQNRGSDSIRSMFLHNSDHPGMVLVTAPLTGSNYLTWSRSMKIVLIAKQKLGFVNGKYVQPDMNSKEYEAWLRADSMVISWILNSISKDIVDAFLYTNTAKELWDELGERFGECNCHAPNPGPTRLADPNRVRGARLRIGTLYLLFFFLN